MYEYEIPSSPVSALFFVKSRLKSRITSILSEKNIIAEKIKDIKIKWLKLTKVLKEVIIIIIHKKLTNGSILLTL